MWYVYLWNIGVYICELEDSIGSTFQNENKVNIVCKICLL